MLLVLSDPNDPTAVRMAAELRRRGADFVVLNPEAAAAHGGLRCSLSLDRAVVDDGEQRVALDCVDAVWLWRPGMPETGGAQARQRFGDALVASYVANEWTALIADALHASGRRWVPGVPSALRRADGKLLQLRLATALGFAVPETLITNGVDEALAFVSRFDGGVIAKPPSVELTRHLMRPALVAYTRAVKPRDLAGIESLGHVPVMLQRRIPKRVELRVTIVGEQVFAAEIHSQKTRRTRDDWRRYDHEHTPLLPHALPDEVSQRLVQLTARLGLCYGTIDLILTPDGEYVFLEINPNGQWTWIEDTAGLPITAALADELLVKGAQR